MTTIAAFIEFNNNINRKILNEKEKVKIYLVIRCI